MSGLAPSGDPYAAMSTRLRRTTLWLVVLLGAGSAGLWALTWYAPGILLVGVDVLLAWCVLLACVHFSLLRGERIKSPTVGWLRYRPWLIGGGIGGIALWSWIHWGLGRYLNRGSAWQPGLQIEQKISLQIATALLLAVACLSYFFFHYVEAVERRLGSRRLQPLLHLLKLAFWSCLAVAGVLFLFLSTARDFGSGLGWAFLATTLFLALEQLAFSIAILYRPKEQKEAAVRSAPFGESAMLDLFFARGGRIRSAIADFERSAGMKIGETWLFLFLRRTLGWIVLGSLLLGWLASCLTMVPMGSSGVRLALGRYEKKALAPGLHLAWPRPLGRIEIVPTGRIRTVSLGFEQDSNEPVLWDNTHVRGEENLLVGNGESLLTINVPILYHVSDAVAYVTHASNPEQAMADLARRRLFCIMGARDGFAVMIEDRAEIADQLRAALQQEVDHLRLGVQVDFVGMQDVHPPVKVAPAYQEVISAQEQMEAVVDNARAARAKTLPAALAKANQLTSQASAAAAAQKAAAQGAASRFLSLANESKEHADLLRFRMRLETLEQTLAQSSKIILAAPRSAKSQPYLIDLR